MVRKLVVCWIAVSLAVPVLAQKSTDGESPTYKEMKERIDRLVGQLGSESWKEREGATKALIRIGIAAVPALEKALKSDDPEVRVRASRALERIREGAKAPRPRPLAGKTEPGKGKKGEPFPNPWGSDFADLLKRLLEDPFARPGGEDWKAWEKKFDERMRRMREDPFGSWEKSLKELLKGLDVEVPDLRRWSAAEKHVDSRDGKAVEVERTARGEVKVVLRSKDDEGRPRVERFSAPSEKAFQEKHPEVYEKYVKGRFSRSPLLVNPGRDPLGDWRKQVDELLRRQRKAWDPDKARKEFEERMRRFRTPWRFQFRGAPGSTRVMFRDGDVTVDLEKKADGGIRLILRSRDEAGRVVENRYEGASEKAFGEKFPKIYERYVKGRISGRGWRVELNPGGRSPQGVRTRRPGFGITSEKVSELMRVHLGLEAGVGFIIKAVAPGSAAEKAGFEKYDLVLKAGGLFVTRPAELEAKLTRAEGPVEVELIRRGQRTTLTVNK